MCWGWFASSVAVLGPSPSWSRLVVVGAAVAGWFGVCWLWLGVGLWTGVTCP